MLLLLDTDGGEKNFNSPLIYSLPIKISVNVNYPNHFHAWHMKTEKSECLYFLLVEEKNQLKILSVPSHCIFFSPTVLSFSVKPGHSLGTNNSHQTEQENAAAHSPSTAGPDKLRGKGGNVPCVLPIPWNSSGAVGSPLLLSALCRARKVPRRSCAMRADRALMLWAGSNPAGLDFPRGFQLRLSQPWSLSALGRAGCDAWRI